ncbi:unnamed protein product [Adineta ricciae]|uniref:HTH CENPB-type domain-containing protein n=1 Tax=Adineta ricciae TaxID=249248 RepID=A0A815X0E6_ADIRI|nr:unnamed protein product [Adineta ricciae]CAF1552406.1 unnamed protein product [Adineta ricciae]
MASNSGKRSTLSIEQRLKILEALKSKKADDVAKYFNIGYSTVKKIRQNEEEIRKVVVNNGNLSRKRKRESPNEEIGEALIVWFHQMRAQNATINGPLMMEKAKQLAITLEHQELKPSHGWLERLKSRHSIKFIKVSGEQASADQAGAKNWIDNVLLGVIEGYDLNDVFNADETGLYYKAAPSGTLAVSGTHPTGGKTPKDRMTVLFLCNSTGTEKKAYVIGKFKNPRCFKKARPPLPYYSSPYICSNELGFSFHPLRSKTVFEKLVFFVNVNNNDVDKWQEVLDISEFGNAIQEEGFKAFVDCDEEAECFGTLTDADICDSVKLNRDGTVDLEEEEVGVVDKPIPGVSHEDALMHLSMVRRYLEENFTDYNSYYDIEDMIEKNISINRSQRKITDFFE